ncbi:hypothetical protein P7C71_g4314, partial [Lecanoromycetidae sp. Uapishka_2]
MAYTVDDEGDLKMMLDGGSLIVSRKALSLSSPVFLAMLGKKSKFQESTDQTIDKNGIQTISFPDDQFQPMLTVARIIHLQSNFVDKEVSFQQLYQIAILCDKYDLRRCLGPWVDIWSKPYLDSFRSEGFHGWLFISKVFRYGDVFKAITRHLIMDCEISATGEHVIGKGHDIAERMPTSIIVSAMVAAPNTIPDVCSALFRRYGEHKPCAVGARLASQAAELVSISFYNVEQTSPFQ